MAIDLAAVQPERGLFAIARRGIELPAQYEELKALFRREATRNSVFPMPRAQFTPVQPPMIQARSHYLQWSGYRAIL